MLFFDRKVRFVAKHLVARYSQGNLCSTFNKKCGAGEIKGLVLGGYSEENNSNRKNIALTKTAKAFDDRVGGKLCELLEVSGRPPERGEMRMFYGLDPDYNAVVLVGLGDDCISYNEREGLDELKELIRMSAGLGVRTLQDHHMDAVDVESFGHAESSAEGAAMAAWVYQEFKSDDNQIKIPKLELYQDCDYCGWQIGLQKAAAQNLTRQLTDTPANMLTPLSFAQMAVDVLGKANINVDVKTKRWAEMNGLEAFLAAAKGSSEPPVFLEASYYSCDRDVPPAVLIGQGVTFDGGGLCLKDSNELKYGKTNMSGAAMAVAVIRAAAALQLPLNVRCLLPLFENLPGVGAFRPGDVIRASNGKTVAVENTDFDGRLSIMDAIAHSSTYRPKFIVDIGSTSKEAGEALGQAATVAFSNNDALFEQLRTAGIHTGDRVWRFPLWEYYSMEVTRSPKADTNHPDEMPGAPCTCAAFLHEFVPGTDWIHLDTHGVARTDGNTWHYLRKGSSGRPTRTLVEFLASLACKQDTTVTQVCESISKNRCRF